MAWSWRGLNERPPLDPEFIWRKGSKGFDRADEHAARSPEDAADFRERLERLCQSLRDDAQLNALGHTMAYGQLKGAVRGRHVLGRLWRRRPELAETPIQAPLIVVGQMRSGTTRLHRLLAADPRHTGTRLCNAMQPILSRPDWRPLKAALILQAGRLINPWLDTLHPFGATRVDEELPWLATALNPCAFEAQWRIKSYLAYSEGRDPAPVYREFARMLRTDAAFCGDGARPRVLKCPQYAEDLAALLVQFPDAQVVVARRDLGDVHASTVSVVASQMAYQSDHVSLEYVESEWRRKLELREARMAEALKGFAGPIAQVQFDELGSDWRSTIARTYAALGLELNPEALAAMEREQASATRSAHRLHADTYRGFARA